MRSIAVALTWEFWRRSRWWIFSAIIVMACITTLMYGRTSSLNAKTHAKIHYITLFYEFICFACLIFSSQFDRKNKRLGFPAHLYVKPTQTWVLVGWQMLLPAVTIVLLYLVSVGCVRISLGVTWPLLGPMLLLAAAVACTQAVFWSMVGFHVLRFGTCLLVLAELQCWQFSRYGAIEGYPNTSRLNEMWIGITFGELLTLVSCLGAAYIVAVIGVSRDRRGDCVGWPGFWGRLDCVRDLLPGRQKPFNSPGAAQFWREWHEKDWLMPAASGFCVAGIILLNIFGISDANVTILLFVQLFQIGLCGPFFAGLIIGQCGRKSKIDDFKATLPVSNSKLSAMILRPGAAGILSALAIYIAGLLFMIGWFFMVGEGETVIRGWHNFIDAVHDDNTLLLVAVGIIIAWGLMGLGASMTFMGRPWLLWGLTLVICSIGPIFIALDTLHALNLIPLGIVPALWSSAPWTIGTCCLFGTAWAFLAARRRYLIASKTLCLGLGVWLMLCISVGFMLFPGKGPELSSIVLAMGLLMLPVAPLATAPLALAWNRHR